MTNIFFVGCNWVMKYLISKILLDDQDQEDSITVFDSTQNVQEFFDFAPISKHAGDERLQFANTLDLKKALENYGPFDTIIVDTNIIEEAKEVSTFKGKSRIIVISSWEVYGWKKRRDIPIDESQPLNPTTQLGQTKAEIERIVGRGTIIRLATLFGPHMPDGEILNWLTALLINQPIEVQQPAARCYDFCYFYNVLPPIQKAITKPDIPSIINIGSSDRDFKDDGKVNVFEKNVVEALVGLRVVLDSQSKITVSDEDIEKYQGKGFHSQLKTEKVCKNLDYYPMTDTLRGFLQTAFWLRKTMEVDEAYAPMLGRAIEDIYPTLDDTKVLKVGETVQSKEMVIEERKQKNIIGKRARAEANKDLVCKICDHAGMTIPPTGCNCKCHVLYIEEE